MSKKKKIKTSKDYLKETPVHIKQSFAFKRGIIIGNVIAYENALALAKRHSKKLRM